MIDLIRNRRSIRKYSDKKIEKEKIHLLKETALRSPTSRNFKPWRFIFIEDKQMLTKLSKAKPHGIAFLANAPLSIVVAANNQESDVWVEDTSIASILLQMTAQSLDLGSCWIQIRKRMHDDNQSAESYIKNILQLPENISIESIIAVGYPAEKREPVDYDELNFNKILPY
jgi:nitroreductase